MRFAPSPQKLITKTPGVTYGSPMVNTPIKSVLYFHLLPPLAALSQRLLTTPSACMDKRRCRFKANCGCRANVTVNGALESGGAAASDDPDPGMPTDVRESVTADVPDSDMQVPGDNRQTHATLTITPPITHPAPPTTHPTPPTTLIAHPATPITHPATPITHPATSTTHPAAPTTHQAVDDASVPVSNNDNSSVSGGPLQVRRKRGRPRWEGS
jgi:hypothetical protein